MFSTYILQHILVTHILNTFVTLSHLAPSQNFVSTQPVNKCHLYIPHYATLHYTTPFTTSNLCKSSPTQINHSLCQSFSQFLSFPSSLYHREGQRYDEEGVAHSQSGIDGSKRHCPEAMEVSHLSNLTPTHTLVHLPYSDAFRLFLDVCTHPTLPHLILSRCIHPSHPLLPHTHPPHPLLPYPLLPYPSKRHLVKLFDSTRWH